MFALLGRIESPQLMRLWMVRRGELCPCQMSDETCFNHLIRPYYTMRWVCVLVKFVSKTRAKREQNASKRKQNASKTQAKRKQNATDLLGSRFGFFLRWARVLDFSPVFLSRFGYQHETTHSVIRPLLFSHLTHNNLKQA